MILSLWCASAAADERVRAVLASVHSSASAAANNSANEPSSATEDRVRNALATASADGDQRKNEGKAFFTEARGRMGATDWQHFLSDIKELQGARVSKQHVLERWMQRFRELHMHDLADKFDSLLSRTHPHS